ncbi:MAG TPA: protein kinase [Polyangiaceae bacterium]
MIGDADDLIGRIVLGRYRIVHRLATGGMGVIYLARSEGAKGFIKPVVIKRILPHLVGDEGLVGMFAREARIMSNLSHPGIVGILDFAEEQGAYLMVLEYVHGFHLGRWNRYVRRTRGLFPIEPAIHIVISVLEALNYAHNLTGPDGEPLHIVHRDVSPSNVLIDTEGRIKLTDFGIARMRTDKTSAEDKRALKGTFSYMAPELLRMGDPSPQSDLYSCAVVLHELLTGKNEFGAKDVATTAWRVIDHVPTSVQASRPDVPSGLDEVLQKALSKEPEQRYQNALEFAQGLRSVRKVPADDAAKALAEAAARDFNDPGMAISLKAADLATLDRKWREPVQKISVAPPSRLRRTDPPTVPTLTVKSISRPRLLLERRKGIVVGALVGVSAAGAAAGAMLMKGRPTAAPLPGVFLVEGSVAPIGLSAQMIPAPAPETSALETGPTIEPALPNAVSSSGKTTVPGAPAGAKGTSAKSRPDALTRAFARQEPQIARCFSQHASEVSGNPEISVRFEVGADGRVVSTQVQPAALAGTPLGGCIAQVARGTDFGPQPAAVSFRIPITARRAH